MYFYLYLYIYMGFPGGSDGKESACIAGDPSLIPGLGRSPGEGNGNWLQYSLLLLLFPFIFISWRLITLQYCSGFCHTLTWISHGFTCAPPPDPPSHLPLHPIPLGLPSAPALSTCLMHPGFLPGEFHGQRSLAGYSPWNCKELDLTFIYTYTYTHIYIQTHTHTHTYRLLYICTLFKIQHMN